uniref:Uncharacterized protein n=1 Tax=Strigamia maritima TaxID=126957 RepID=T1JFW1_STRMM
MLLMLGSHLTETQTENFLLQKILSAEKSQERDEFADRLKRKDKTKTRNIIVEKSGFEEAAKRLGVEDRKKIIPKLRVESRRKYLIKRKEDKLVELECDIQDEDYFFSEMTLTKPEKTKQQYKRNLLQLVGEHEKAGELEKIERYHMPEDDKAKNRLPIKKKYVDKEISRNYEQRKWEEKQMDSAKMRFGAAKHKEKGKNYEINYSRNGSNRICPNFDNAWKPRQRKKQEKRCELNEKKKKENIEETYQFFHFNKM